MRIEMSSWGVAQQEISMALQGIAIARTGTLSRRKKSTITPTERNHSETIKVLLDTELLGNQQPNDLQKVEPAKSQTTTLANESSLNSVQIAKEHEELIAVLRPLLIRTKIASIQFTDDCYVDINVYLTEVAKASNVASQMTHADLDDKLPWRLQCRVTGFEREKNSAVEEDCQYYCRLGLMTLNDWKTLDHGNLQEKDAYCTKPKSIPFWYAIKPGSVPLWDDAFEFPVSQVQEKVILVEVWRQECKANNTGTIINHSKSTFIGRVALELSHIPMDYRRATERYIFSHSMKHTRGKVLLELCLRQPETDLTPQAATRNYTHLFKAVVNYESTQHGKGDEVASTLVEGGDEGGAHQELGTCAFIPKWTAQLSPKAKQLLHTYATWLNIGDLQRADLELSVLLNYRVETEAFIELLNEIEAKAGRGESVSSNREAGPQAHTTASGDSWSSELQATLVGLSNHCKHRLEHHLDIIKLDELREVLKVMQKLYTVIPFVSNLPADEQGFHKTLEKCAKDGIEHWFEISDADFQPKKMDHQCRAVSLKALTECCATMSELVQGHVVGIFKDFNVDYFSIFIQVIGSKLHKVTNQYIMKESNLLSDRDTASIYYQAFQISRRMQNRASAFDPRLSKESDLFLSHKWYKPLVLSWISAAKETCKGRIQKAVELDEVVRVVGEAKYSSSAIDVATFLYQMVKFWKELDWPDVEECFPFSLLHLQAICDCADFYMETCYKQLVSKNVYNASGQFSASEQVCILFNNMAHIKSQLDTLVQGLGVESLCERMKDRAESTVQTLDNLKRSTVEDINNKIFKALHKFSKMLAPDITTFIKSIMASGDVTSSTEVLLEFLTKNLKTFSEYLLDDVFHKVLQCVWSVTITSAQSALWSGTQSQTECSQLSATVQVLKEFFNADGNGLTDKKLESEEYMALVSEIAVKCLSAKDLTLQCCLELVQQQPEITGSSPIGELSFSIVYLEQKSALEVNILNAKLVNGDRYKKDGSADTFVQAWLLPQMVFHDCSKASYKTDLKKGTLNPVYYKEVHLPAQLEDLRSDGAILVLAVYFTDMKRIAGLCVVPCKDVPVLQNESGRKKITLPLFLAKMHNNGPLKELKDRQTLQDPELTDLYLHLVKKLYASLPN